MFKYRLFFLINIILFFQAFAQVPIRFGDVVQLSSTKFDRNLWIYGSGKKKQILVGPSSDIRTKNGSQLFAIKSSTGKKGFINYGDEILIVPFFYSEGSKVFSCNKKDTFSVNKNDSNVLINNVDDHSNSFIFKKNAQDRRNICSEDSLQIWSKPFNKKLYATYSSSFGNNWYELLIDIKNKDLNKQDFFRIKKVASKKVKEIINEKFENDLLRIKELSSKSERIDSVKNLLASMPLDISLKNKNDLFVYLKKFFDKRNKLDELHINKFQNCLNQALYSVLDPSQKKIIGHWIQSLNETKFENIIIKKIKLADSKKDFDSKISVYGDVLKLTKNPLGKSKYHLFFNSLDKLFKSKKNMNLVQLNSLRTLFKNSQKNLMEMNFLQEKDLKLKILDQNNLDLEFYVRLYEVEHSDGEEKTKKFNKIVPFLSKNVSNELKLNCLELLNKALGSKVEELRTMRELLDLAMTKTTDNC